jgi:hypothetical protein
MPTVTKATKVDYVYSHEELRKILSWEAFGHYNANITLVTVDDEASICATEVVEEDSTHITFYPRK